jgi:BirA family biotin operon repressor/biotin-[acetyl-CoA-carboxylase] ligase
MTPDILNKENIRSLPKGEIVGNEIVFFSSIASTNQKAMEIGIERDNCEGIVVIADSQTSGRGRLGRRWISPPGVNLYFTILFKPPFQPKEASIMTLTAAVAVVSAIRNNTGLKAEIKWPNDIYLNGKKTGGILTEMKIGNNRIRFLAVGIGVNVNMLPDMLDSNVRPFSTSLKAEKGEPVNRTGLLKEILREMEKQYKILLTGNKRAIISKWLEFNSTIGRNIRVQIQDRTISGMAEGINEEGELIIKRASGKSETVSAGDVTILKGSTPKELQ